MSTIVRFAPVALAVVAAASVGCKSGAGSRWAWNPWSKPAPEAIAATDSKLPSSGVTPQVETLASKDKPTAAATTVKTTPPALEGVAPKFEAVAAAAPTPTIDKPAPSSPNWSQYPTSPASNPVSATLPAIASAPPTPASVQAVANTAASAASSGPYNPNGYQPQLAAAATGAAAATAGLGDRYGALPTTDLPDLKAATTATAQTAQQTADRYAASAQATTTNAVGSWFDSVATSEPAKAVATAVATPAATAPLAAASAYPTTGVAATTPIATPAASPYPTTTPIAGTSPYPTVGALPPATTPVATTASTGSTVNLTSAAGGYRPGGTSTYPTSVSVATRPTTPTTTTTPVAPTSTTPSRY